MRTPVTGAEEPSVDVKLCLVFPREALSVPVMRHMLGDALRGLGADDDGLAELLLAVTEACTNVVRHGGPGRRYEVVASLGRRGCRIEVQNSWPGFALRRLPGLRRRPWPAAAATARNRRRGGRPASLLGAPWAGHGPATSAEAIRDEDIAALPESGRGFDIMRACGRRLDLRRAGSLPSWHHLARSRDACEGTHDGSGGDRYFPRVPRRPG